MTKRIVGAPLASPRPATHISSVRFDIQRLSLPGYTPAQQRRFTRTLSAALELFVARHGYARAFGKRIAQLDGGNLRAGATPEQAARQIAQRIVARLGIDASRHSDV